MIKDIKNVFEKDPAARSVLEVLLCYPGLHALWAHRLSNWFWRHKLKFFGRLNSHLARFVTQIEIHPGATIGRRFFIDHGCGVVIGETSVIGDDVLIYKGVVLGGTSLSKDKRHPTLEDGVVVGTNAVVLGDITIGQNSRIGAGSVVVKSVPAESTVVGVPGRVMEEKQHTDLLDHGQLPDPLVAALKAYNETIAVLEKRLTELEKKTNR